MVSSSLANLGQADADGTRATEVALTLGDLDTLRKRFFKCLLVVACLEKVRERSPRFRVFRGNLKSVWTPHRERDFSIDI